MTVIKALVDDTDGRRRRSHDSRARIIAAMLDLVRGGEITPGAEQVAERAQVGLRTVFRHFKDMDSLYREIAHAMESELMKVVARPFKGETWRERVLELIERRAPAFEKIAPFRKASDALRHTSAFVAARHGVLAMQSRQVLMRILPTEVAEDVLTLECLDLLLSYEAWERLRNEQGLSQRRAREVLAAAVGRVLDGRSA